MPQYIRSQFGDRAFPRAESVALAFPLLPTSRIDCVCQRSQARCWPAQVSESMLKVSSAPQSHHTEQGRVIGA